MRLNAHETGGTDPRPESAGAPGWPATKRRDWASIWSNERLTEGKSGLCKWEVRALEAVKSDDRLLDAMLAARVGRKGIEFERLR